MVANNETNGRYHSDWLSMMQSRLRLSRNLLKNDGVIFISVDDHEIANLRSMCDEVFGAGNFVATVIWQKVFAPKNTARWFSEDHDYLLVYAKSINYWNPVPLPKTEEMLARYKNLDKDPRGKWQSDNLTAWNQYDAGLYAVKCPSGRVIEGPPKGSYWRISEKKFRELDEDNRIWWGEEGNNMPRLKRFLTEVKQGKTPQTLWPYKEVGHTQDAKKTLLKFVEFEHTENVLNSVKPVELIQRMLQLAGPPDEEAIVLDFFGGSATTAHAVLQQNAIDGGKRSFVIVQMG
jgi:adenine-specific DNA-methyltransferase